MRSYFHTSIFVIAYSLIFQACTPLEVNPGFGKKDSSDPVARLGSGTEAQKPVWKVGYEWYYEMERSGQTGTMTYRIIGEDEFSGIPCFVIQRGRSERYYTKDVLGFLARERGGEIVVKRSAPQQPYAWPLRVGKKWRNVFTLQRVQEGYSTDVDRWAVVSKLEQVTVPAGTFKTFRIEVYRSNDGSLVSEWWYSPEVRSFVKNIRYRGRGREERLISYKID